MKDSACVFIIDDDPAIGDALSILVESIGLTAKTYTSADTFLTTVDEDQPGCVVSDICLPGIDGMQLQQIMLERAIGLPLIAISAHGDIPMAVEMVRRGAVDFLEKPFRNHVVIARIREAIEIDRKRRAEVELRRSVVDNLAELTPRERDVLPGLVHGLSSKQIALALDLSPRTVEAHRANILRKMGVDSATALAHRLSGAEIDFAVDAAHLGVS